MEDSISNLFKDAGSEHKTVLVYFLGGITFSEIAALRFLQKKILPQYKITIATTSIINAKTAI